jgi:hypothetical protein
VFKKLGLDPLPKNDSESVEMVHLYAPSNHNVIFAMFEGIRKQVFTYERVRLCTFQCLVSDDDFQVGFQQL